MSENGRVARADGSLPSDSASAGHGTAPAYRRDIDGLRAVAVLSVAFYHARLSGFSGGFVGVDIFFVISGYLITQILVREVDRGSFSLLGFYERRIRRIFPALFAVQLMVLAVGCWLLLPDDLVAAARSVVATTLFSANFLYFSEAGYFDAPSWTKPLLHTWSLAVEEQFYIVFPALLLLARRKLSGRYIAPTLATVVVSFIVCAVGTNNFREAAFYLAPTRAWELGLGCLLALGAVPGPRGRGARELASLVGIALIAYSVVHYTDETKFPGFSTLPPCLGATLILWAGIDGSSAVGRVLSTGPAVFIGLISYSLYLWHWPLLVFASYLPARPLTALEASAVLAVSTLLAAASWRWIERPFRGAKSRVARPALLRGAVGISLATAAAGVAIAFTGGLPGRVDSTVAGLVATRAEKDSTREWCNFSRIGKATWVKDLGDPSAADATFVVWGDSHACMMAEAIDSLARSSGRRGYLAWAGGCPPLLLEHSDPIKWTKCSEANEHVVAAVSADPRLTDVVMIGRWGVYFEGRGYGQERVRVPLQVLDRAKGPAEVLAGILERTETRLAGLGRRVWVVGPVPEAAVDVPAALARARILGWDPNVAPPLAEYLERQRAVFAALDRPGGSPLVHVLHPHELLCRDAHCEVAHDGVALYRDNNHLSLAGATVVAAIFEPLFPPAER